MVENKVKSFDAHLLPLMPATSKQAHMLNEVLNYYA